MRFNLILVFIFGHVAGWHSKFSNLICVVIFVPQLFPSDLFHYLNPNKLFSLEAVVFQEKEQLSVWINCFASKSSYFKKARCLVTSSPSELQPVGYNRLKHSSRCDFGHSKFIPPIQVVYSAGSWWPCKVPFQSGLMKWRHMHIEKVRSNYPEVLMVETGLSPQTPVFDIIGHCILLLILLIANLIGYCFSII